MCPGHGHVEGAFRDGERGALPWIDEPDPLRGIGSHHQPLGRALDPDDRRAMLVALDGVRTHGRVVLARDPRPGAQVGMAQERLQHGTRVHAPFGQTRAVHHRGRGAFSRDRDRPALGGGGSDTLMDDRLAGQRRGRDACKLACTRSGVTRLIQATGHDSDEAVIGHPADDRGGQVPAAADLQHMGQLCRGDDGQHPLLGLGDR